jgi:riboflavin kinase/FMN adenylyltransferase
MSRELGFYADEVDEVCLRGQRISSSKIRELLKNGQVNLARRMLGRPYGIEGQIIHGDRRGRTIGFPTANLKPTNRVIPKFGVYATANLIDGVWRRSITNVGVRPTFAGDKEPSIESYIFDFDGDLYGDVLRVRFLHRVREERKFTGIEELKNQIAQDSKYTLNYFKRLGVKNSLSIV